METSSLLFYFLLQLVKGRYYLNVEVHSYSNPANRCASGCGQGCCDRPLQTTCSSQDSSRCDNQFFFCVRPFGTLAPSLNTLEAIASDTLNADLQNMLNCSIPYRSNINFNGQPINYVGQDFLGLPNPIPFMVTSRTQEVSVMWCLI